MQLFKRIVSLFTSPAGPVRDSSAYWITVRCRRCSEIIRARVDLRNDLSIEYGDDGATYFCRKTLMGEGHCFQRVEVALTFDGKYRVIEREITGGEFVDNPPA